MRHKAFTSQEDGLNGGVCSLGFMVGVQGLGFRILGGLAVLWSLTLLRLRGRTLQAGPLYTQTRNLNP